MLTNSKSLADHAGEIVGLAHAHKFLAICVYDPIGVVRWIFREHDVAAPMGFRRHHIDADALTVCKTILAI